MKTIALRFSDSFATAAGTIAEHKKLIEKDGYVWYGKLGASVSDRICKELLETSEPRILLIHSGKSACYWAYIDKVSKEVPPLENIPEYYRDQAKIFRTWFRVKRIEEAEKNVMSMCTVASSGASLSVTSRSSMSPYFIIDYAEGENNVRTVE